MHPSITNTGNYLKKQYEAIPPDKRRRTRNIIIIIVLILIFKNKIIDGIRNLFHRDINKIDVDKGNLSYEKGEYYSMCSTLESAMDGTGTDEEAINSVIMRMQSQDDWNFLQKSFGVRKKDGGTFYADITGDLKMWLGDELDSSEMEEIKEILIGQGVNY
ncbi:MAG TPA: hypothetical protein DEA97_06445 [Bacteroidales bacterium]|nr:MAG: hypothetical protein UR43_C0021G0011 [candidate division TM6 bacterium GW2011_GWF2_33_332]OFY79627.1 MAG: hypothetical protein A2281_13460 [Bacteroidetes bacterium RIFOXYA12_FULL_38_20]HBS86174.1 hypothetical protein [Bacteroidales bacterium]